MKCEKDQTDRGGVSGLTQTGPRKKEINKINKPHIKLDGKYSERVQIPAKAFLSPTLGNTCYTYYANSSTISGAFVTV